MPGVIPLVKHSSPPVQQTAKKKQDGLELFELILKMLPLLEQLLERVGQVMERILCRGVVYGVFMPPVT